MKIKKTLAVLSAMVMLMMTACGDSEDSSSKKSKKSGGSSDSVVSQAEDSKSEDESEGETSETESESDTESATLTDEYRKMFSEMIHSKNLDEETGKIITDETDEKTGTRTVVYEATNKEGTKIFTVTKIIEEYSITTNTDSRPVDAEKPDTDNIVVETEKFEYGKNYYALSEDGTMLFKMTEHGNSSSRVTILNLDNMNHSIYGELKTLREFDENKIGEEWYSSDVLKEYGGTTQIMWRYNDKIPLGDRGGYTYEFPYNCQPLDYTINGSTFTMTFVEYEVIDKMISYTDDRGEEHVMRDDEGRVTYDNNTAQTVTFKFISESKYNSIAPEGE